MTTELMPAPPELKALFEQCGASGIETGSDAIDALTLACHKTDNDTASENERFLCAGLLITHIQCRAGLEGACFNFQVIDDRAKEEGEEAVWARSTNRLVEKIQE